ncbi:uncharacterized protein LOC115625454 [Scaptodrosophila lebanonensis]|uniref:Uncharacterized protein LOC115625454 n=1 Tax=Drosophila lebanonensis TaxID=7225 RepID=A0A6J2TMZ5_DROLE|nr:uncharacterized protein LOC115625454 [Scaptodrosophila lebanonensis]
MNPELAVNPEQSAAEVRRNLRRKKILESAKNRLEKLNGRACDVQARIVDNPTEVLQYSDPEVEPDSPIHTPFQGGLPKNLFTETEPVTTNKFIKSRGHIFVSALIGYAVSIYTSSSIFLVPGLLTIIELIYFRAYQSFNSNSLIMPLILLLTSSRLSSKINQINAILSITQSVLVDLAICIFCFCFIGYIQGTLNITYFNIVYMLSKKHGESFWIIACIIWKPICVTKIEVTQMHVHMYYI